MEGDGCKTVGCNISRQTCWEGVKWPLELDFTWGDSSTHRICTAKMSIRPKRWHFRCKLLSFQLFTQLNCVIAVENILTRANYFNLSDPTVVLYWRAGGGLEISKRNRGIPPLVQAIHHNKHWSNLLVTLPNSIWKICTVYNSTWLCYIDILEH